LKITALATLAAAGALLLALPASAAVPSFKGTVGPGFTISMASKPKTVGKIRLVIADKSGDHNFHLTGPGGKAVTALNVKTNKTVKSLSTSVGATGTSTFILTLKKGTYKFVCDPHASSMKGSFTVK
jgi:plastocyanin